MNEPEAAVGANEELTDTDPEEEFFTLDKLIVL
jgi:hypothetical protein